MDKKTKEASDKQTPQNKIETDNHINVQKIQLTRSKSIINLIHLRR